MNTQESIEQEYRLLVYKYLSQSATPEEKTTLLNWLQQSEENKKLFSDYKKIFDLTAGLNCKGKFSHLKKSSLHRLKLNIDPLAKGKNHSRVKELKYYLRIAASVLIIFSIGALASLWYSKSNSAKNLSKVKYHLVVPMGGKSELVLPDGTKVWLNAGSSLCYYGDYGVQNRDVFLEGEGFFSVIKNQAQPFIVKTSGLEIKAYGTSFNVKAYPEERYVTTTLVEGIVKIEGRGLNLSLKPKEVIMLEKNSLRITSNENKETDSSLENKKTTPLRIEQKEESSFSKSIQLKSDINTNIYTSWKDNYWIIESEPLKNLVRILERKFDVIIQIESPELNQYTFTGTFYKETLEQILDILKLTAPLKYEINKGIVIIKSERHRKSIYDNFKN